jgi:hypothetical protein
MPPFGERWALAHRFPCCGQAIVSEQTVSRGLDEQLRIVICYPFDRIVAVRGCEKIRLAPRENRQNLGKSVGGKVPVPVLSQPLRVSVLSFPLDRNYLS